MAAAGCSGGNIVTAEGGSLIEERAHLWRFSRTEPGRVERGSSTLAPRAITHRAWRYRAGPLRSIRAPSATTPATRATCHTALRRKLRTSRLRVSMAHLLRSVFSLRLRHKAMQLRQLLG